MRRSRAGFTLMELIIVVLIVGILGAAAVPQYLRTVEVSKFDDAVSTLNMIGMSNRMFALDHNGYYVTGTFTASCSASGSCPTAVAATQTDPCILVYCKYLNNQDWAGRPYTYSACNGAASGACSGIGSGYQSAVARRLTTVSAPYNTWTLALGTNGTVTAGGTNVPTPTY